MVTQPKFDPAAAAAKLSGPPLRHRLDLADYRQSLEPAVTCWMRIDEGRYLGFRKGGIWRWYGRMLVRGSRRHRGTTLGYVSETPVTKDDGPKLTFDEAVEALHRWVEGFPDCCPLGGTRRPLEMPTAPKGNRFTVAEAAIDFLECLRRSGKDWINARSFVVNKVLPSLGPIRLRELEARDIERWHMELATGGGNDPSDGDTWLVRRLPPDDDQARRRRRTANWYLYCLKLILDRAYAQGRIGSNEAWKAVPPFQHVRAARYRTLSDQDIARLLSCASDAGRALFSVALATGCRLAELRRLTVGDYSQGAGKLRVLDSKSWRTRHMLLAGDGDALIRGLVTNRDPDEPLLVREDRRPWTRASARARVSKTSLRAALDPPANFTVFRHTYAARAAMAGMPIRDLSRQLGHRNAWITEQYYGLLTLDQTDDRIRHLLPRVLNPGDHPA